MANKPLSPYEQITEDFSSAVNVAQQGIGGDFEVPDISKIELPKGKRPTASPSATKSGDMLPPAELRPMFDSAARKYGVPVNVLMALGHQESRYKSDAEGPDTQWGKAGGLMQYLDSTAQSLGIDRFDPKQSIDAAAKQIKERLDKGYSMEDAVKEHFAGTDRKKWGGKTDAYGKEVLGKAGQIFDALNKQPEGASKLAAMDSPDNIERRAQAADQAAAKASATNPRAIERVAGTMGISDAMQDKIMPRATRKGTDLVDFKDDYEYGRHLANLAAKNKPTTEDLSSPAGRAVQSVGRGILETLRDAADFADKRGFGTKPIKDAIQGVIDTGDKVDPIAGALNLLNAPVRGVNSAAWGGMAAAADFMRQPELADYFKQQQAAQQKLGQTTSQARAFEKGIGRDIVQGVESSAEQALPFLASIGTGTVGPMAAYGGISSGADAYNKAREQGLERTDALKSGLIQGGAESIGEAFGASKVFAALNAASAGRPVLGKLLQAAIAEPASEIATQIMQSATDQFYGVGVDASGNQRRAGDWAQFEKSIAEEAQSAGIGGAVGALMMGGGGYAAGKLPISRKQAGEIAAKAPELQVNPDDGTLTKAMKRGEHRNVTEGILQGVTAPPDESPYVEENAAPVEPAPIPATEQPAAVVEQPAAPAMEAAPAIEAVPAIEIQPEQQGETIETQPEKVDEKATEAPSAEAETGFKATHTDQYGAQLARVNGEWIDSDGVVYENPDVEPIKAAEKPAKSAEAISTAPKSAAPVVAEPKPVETKPEPVAEQKLSDMDEPALRARLKDMAKQAKQSGWTKQALAARREVEKEIKKRTAQPEKKTASWVIREKDGGKVIMETFDKKKVDALNTDKYEAVPVEKYLPELNKAIAEDSAKAPSIDLNKKESATALRQENQSAISDAGAEAFSKGEPRKAPDFMNIQSKKIWLDGWDKANVSTPTIKEALTVEKPSVDADKSQDTKQGYAPEANAAPASGKDTSTKQPEIKAVIESANKKPKAAPEPKPEGKEQEAPAVADKAAESTPDQETKPKIKDAVTLDNGVTLNKFQAAEMKRGGGGLAGELVPSVQQSLIDMRDNPNVPSMRQIVGKHYKTGEPTYSYDGSTKPAFIQLGGGYAVRGYKMGDSVMQEISLPNDMVIRRVLNEDGTVYGEAEGDYAQIVEGAGFAEAEQYMRDFAQQRSTPRVEQTYYPASDSKPVVNESLTTEAPDALTMTPKQYHVARMRGMVNEAEGITYAEVKENYDTEGGIEQHNKEWLDAVTQAAKRGETLTRATLDKVEELRPKYAAELINRLGGKAEGGVYQPPSARRAEAEDKAGRIADKKAIKAEHAQEPAAPVVAEKTTTETAPEKPKKAPALKATPDNSAKAARDLKRFFDAKGFDFAGGAYKGGAKLVKGALRGVSWEGLLNIGYELKDGQWVLDPFLTEKPTNLAQQERFEVASQATDWLNKTGDVKFSAQAAPKMVSIHNLSPENLLFAEKMGGIAVPSIAIIGEDKGGVDGFGEITLIGKKHLGDPSQQPIFSADAYTARFPRPVYSAVPQGKADKFIRELQPIAKEFGDEHTTGGLYDLMVNTPDLSDAIYKLESSVIGRAEFLRSKGIEVKPIVEPLNKGAMLSDEKLTDLKPLFDAIDQNKRIDEMMESPEFKALSEKYAELVAEKYKGKPASMIERLSELDYGGLSRLGRSVDNIGKSTVNTTKTNIELGRIIEGRQSMEADDAMQKRDALIEKYGASSLIAARAKMTPEDRALERQYTEQITSGKKISDDMRAEYHQWIVDKVTPQFGEPKLAIGSKKVPYTLENIVKVMTDKKVKGQEKTMTYGAGQVRAESSVQFSDIEQMRKAAEKSIVDPDQYYKAKEETEKKLSAYRDAVIGFTKLTNWKGHPDTFEANDSAMRAIAKWATGKDKTAAGFQKALTREDFGKVPADVIQIGMDAAEALLNAPVPYFEAKPQRAVTLDEFAGAVIPRGTSKEIKDILDKHGITYELYDKENEGQRDAVRRKLAAKLDKKQGVSFSAEKPSSMGGEGRGASVDQVRYSISQGVGGNAIDKLIADGEIIIHATQLESPFANVAFDENGDAVRINGATDGKHRIHLIAENLSPETARATLYHEYFHRGVKPLVGDVAWLKLMDDLGKLYRQAERSTGKAGYLMKMAKSRVDSALSNDTAKESTKHEEFGAYLIEEYESLPAAYKGWVDRVIGKLKAWLLQRFGAQFGRVTPAQLRELAVYAIRSEIKGTGSAEKMSAVPSPESAAATYLTTLAKYGPDMFDYGIAPKSAKRLKDVAKAIDPAIKVGEPMPDKDGSISYLVTMPDGKPATVVTQGKYVYIDASQLKAGQSAGSKLYALVGNYAFNNGKVFAGDPADLSLKALIRRTELMTSLALKFGTTDFMLPHNKQIDPTSGKVMVDPVTGEKKTTMWTEQEAAIAEKMTPLRWSDDSRQNMINLLQSSYNNTITLAPDIKDISYDFDRREFVNRDGSSASNDEFNRIAKDAAQRFKFDMGLRERQDGETTGGGDVLRRGERAGEAATNAEYAWSPTGSRALKNAAIVGSILREASSPAGRRTLLDSLGQQLSGRGLDQALAGTRYSAADKRKRADERQPSFEAARRATEQGKNISVIGSKADETSRALDRAVNVLRTTWGIVRDYEKQLPSIRRAYDLQGKMDGRRLSIATEGSKTFGKAFSDMALSDPATADTLSDLMTEATLWQINPDQAANPRWKPAWKDKHAELKETYDALPKEAKAIYQAAQTFYAERSDDVKAALIERINSLNIDDRKKAAMLKELQAKYDKELGTGPYFPLSRFGDYLTIATKEVNGERQRIVLASESLYEATAKADSLNQSGWTAKVEMSVNKNTDVDMRQASELISKLAIAIDQGFEETVNQAEALYERGKKLVKIDAAEQRKLNAMPSVKEKIDAILKLARDQANGDPDKFNEIADFANDVDEAASTLDAARAQDALLDQLNQLFIDSLPMASARKNFTHRKGIAGFSYDMARALNQSVVKIAGQVAKLEYSQRIDDALTSAADEAKNSPDNIELQPVADELRQRFESSLKFKVNPIAAGFQQFGFAMTLAYNFSSAAVNIMQMQLGAAVMGTKHGLVKSEVALTRAIADIGRTLKIKDAEAGHIFDLRKKGSPINSNEREALDALEQLGKIDVTFAMDAYREAHTPNEYRTKTERAMKAVIGGMGVFMHSAEVINRQAVALSAYRLERKAGATHEAAIKYAAEMLDDTQFNMNISNQPRFMHNNVVRVLAQYKGFMINLADLLGRTMHTALSDRPKAERIAATKAIGSLLLVQTAMAGVTSLPLYFGAAAGGAKAASMLAKAAGAGKSAQRLAGFAGAGLGAAVLGAFLTGAMASDDEPWDWRAEFRKWMKENSTATVAQMFDRGLLSLMGIDIADRISMNGLFFRELQMQFGAKKGQDAVKEAATGLLGVAFSKLAVGIARAYDANEQGDTMAAVSALLPVPVANLIKGYDYAANGLTDKKSGVKLGDLNAAQVLAQSAGFQPTEVREANWKKSIAYGYDRQMQERKSDLVEKWAKAIESGDQGKIDAAELAAETWSDKNGMYYKPISGKDAMSRMKQMDDAELMATGEARTKSQAQQIDRRKAFMQGLGE